MYGIPEGETFAFLRGRSLDQLSFDRHQLIMHLDEAISVTVEGELGVRPPGGQETVVEDTRDVAATLVSVLGNRIADVAVNNRRSFSMTFEGGLSVRVIDGTDDYESFQVKDGERLIVV